MATSAAPPLTAEDYRMLPEPGPQYQLIEGDLFKAAAPNRYHQHLSRNIEFIVLQWIKGGGGGEIYNAPFDVYLDEFNVFQPDLLYVSPENLGILTDAGASGAPDLVVEILSPRTRRLDLGPKKKVFTRLGVKEMWIVDPEVKALSLFILQTDPDMAAKEFSQSDRFTSDILPGLEIDCREVFAW